MPLGASVIVVVVVVAAQHTPHSLTFPVRTINLPTSQLRKQDTPHSRIERFLLGCHIVSIVPLHCPPAHQPGTDNLT